MNILCSRYVSSVRPSSCSSHNTRGCTPILQMDSDTSKSGRRQGCAIVTGSTSSATSTVRTGHGGCEEGNRRSSSKLQKAMLPEFWHVEACIQSLLPSPVRQNLKASAGHEHSHREIDTDHMLATERDSALMNTDRSVASLQVSGSLQVSFKVRSTSLSRCNPHRSAFLQHRSATTPDQPDNFIIITPASPTMVLR